MEKRIGTHSKAAAALLAAALLAVVMMMGAMAPHPALAGEPMVDGIVISLGEAAAHEDGALIYEVSSYRLAASGEVVELDEPFTVTVPETAQ